MVGSREEAAKQRQQAQQGAAAAGRVGQAVKRARATSTSTSRAQSKQEKQIESEVSKSLKKSNGLVQAALEHLESAERYWDKHVAESRVVIDEYPSEEQVLTFMSKMSRQRQRMCLAQRICTVRDYISLHDNSLSTPPSTDRTLIN